MWDIKGRREVSREIDRGSPIKDRGYRKMNAASGGEKISRSSCDFGVNLAGSDFRFAARKISRTMTLA
jgi:hypothetical protein